MSAAERGRLRRAMDHATHSGFPWSMGGADGHSLALRRALRRSVVGHWPPGVRLPGTVLMALLWPFESLRDALVFSFELDRAVLGPRRRLRVAMGAWAAALRWNLPPVDYLAYRLFEPGRPGPGHWLHSADAHIHFRYLAAREVREMVEDKLAFAKFGAGCGAPVVPVLAASGPVQPTMPFANGVPPVDLMVKPRRGHGGRGQTVWRWDGTRHVAGVETDLHGWLVKASADLVVQALARPPAQLGPLTPAVPPLLSVITVEWPSRRRTTAFAMLTVEFEEAGGRIRCGRLVDIETGAVQPVSPGDAAPVWGGAPDRRDLGAFAVPGWTEILSELDRYHAALPGPAPVLKWDVLLTDEGPRILEANTGTGVHVQQAMTLRPLSETPLGAVLEAWAR